MPPFLFGQVRIVLGDNPAGPGTTYDIPFSAGLLSAAPWILLLGMLLLPANRNRQAWRVLIPFAVSYGLICGFSVLMDLRSAPANGSISVAKAYVLGMTYLWLMGHLLGRSGVRALLLAAAITMLALAAYSGAGIDLSLFRDNLPGLGTLITPQFALLASIAVLAPIMRRRGNLEGFDAYVGVLCVFVGAMYTTALYSIVMTQLPGTGVVALIFGVCMGGLTGFCSYLLALPFLNLARRNPFYRARLNDALGIRISTPAPDSDPAETQKEVAV